MIGVTQDEAVLTIELQRPERRNALNSQLVEELRQAVQKAATENVRAIVLTGQGTVFCAGADLSGDAFAADYPDRLIALTACDKLSRPFPTPFCNLGLVSQQERQQRDGFPNGDDLEGLDK